MQPYNVIHSVAYHGTQYVLPSYHEVGEYLQQEPLQNITTIYTTDNSGCERRDMGSLRYIGEDFHPYKNLMIWDAGYY